MIYNPDGWPEDHAFVENLDPDDDGGMAVTNSDGWTLYVRPEEMEAGGAIEVGEPMVTMGGLGSQIRGIFIGDRKYRYDTRVEAEIQRQELIAEYERQKLERFYVNIADWTKRKEALPEPYKSRMNKFIHKKGVQEFWVEDGGYELFILEESAKLYNEAAKHDDPIQWLDDFKSLDWKEQVAIVSDAHSGNTFGGAVGLAKAVHRGDAI